ncbi:MAG: hypothetical protein ABGW97_02865 [Christiangramia sp.]|uniref:hypothetical protein n=1 Tax=Christiangramia sp. TaxID=1931228 RepID=UPI003242DA87
MTNEYEDKSELDLNNRLIAKFEIPKNNKFWGSGFMKIPKSALYPPQDRIESICREIGEEVSIELEPTGLGQFLQTWTKIEQNLMQEARIYKRNVFTTRDAIMVLLNVTENDQKYGIIKQFDSIRKFRNKLVHFPTEISNTKLSENIRFMDSLWKNYKKKSR